MTRCFTSYLVKNFYKLKEKFDDEVIHEVPRQKFYNLKEKCDDEVFDEVPRQKFID